MLPRISLIIPARNEEAVIGNCIESLLKLDYPKNKLEIIVAVDGSTDRTLEICKSYEPRIKVKESTPKKCKAGVLNEVIPSTKGEIIGIYDADCIVEKNCLKKAIKHFSDKDVAGVSCALKSSNKNQNLLTRTLSIETCLMSFSEHFLHSRGANSIFFGRNMFIRKSVLEKVGKFDETLYMEDGELNIKLRRLGYNIAFEPHAIAWTEEPSNIKSFISQRKRWSRGFIRLTKKYPYSSFRNFISDTIHGIHFYISPLSLISTVLLVVLLFFNLPLIFISPLIALFLFNFYLIVGSRLFFKESLKDLLLLPLFFIIDNLFIVIMIKSLYDEKINKEMKWFRADRSGLFIK